MEAQYNDSTGQTIGIVFDLHKYNLTSEQYELIDTASVAANSGSHNFTILNAVNGTYRVYANGTNYLFSQGNISRMGEHYFRPTYGYDMGWPAYLYNFFDILILIIIGLTSVKRHALAGAVFMLFMSWVFVLIGWTSNLGVSALIIPVMLSVFTIIIFLYAAAKWRRETGV
jgi:hypothetical protein